MKNFVLFIVVSIFHIAGAHAESRRTFIGEIIEYRMHDNLKLTECRVDIWNDYQGLRIYIYEKDNSDIGLINTKVNTAGTVRSLQERVYVNINKSLARTSFKHMLVYQEGKFIMEEEVKYFDENRIDFDHLKSGFILSLNADLTFPLDQVLEAYRYSHYHELTPSLVEFKCTNFKERK
jgi:hypothetical protein